MSKGREQDLDAQDAALRQKTRGRGVTRFDATGHPMPQLDVSQPAMAKIQPMVDHRWSLEGKPKTDPKPKTEEQKKDDLSD